jgi:hypothetical protein
MKRWHHVAAAAVVGTIGWLVYRRRSRDPRQQAADELNKHTSTSISAEDIEINNGRAELTEQARRNELSSTTTHDIGGDD